MKKILILGVTFLLFSINACAERIMPAYVKPGTQAPVFTLKNLDDQEISLTQFKNEKSVLVLFWVTNCYICKIELRKLVKVYPKLKEKNIEIISINVGESKEKIRSFAEDCKINFPVLLDYNGRVANLYKLIGFPTLVLVDKNGIIDFVDYELPPKYQN